MCDGEFPILPLIAPLFTKQCPTPFGGVGHTRKSGIQAYKKRRDCAYKKTAIRNRRLYVYIRTAFAVPEAAFSLCLFRLASLSSCVSFVHEERAVKPPFVPIAYSPIDAATAQFAKDNAAEALSAHA